MVHQTNKLPGEKLAILEKSLRGGCANIVFGLGGGEEAYKEALRRLRHRYGRRDFMRASHLHAIDGLHQMKGDAAGFKRYANWIRTHLSDLTKIDETSHSDIIDRITQRLQLNDRLSWNEGRPSDVETRTMNQFSS